MNKYIALFLAIILSLSLFSCLSNKNLSVDSENFSNTATDSIAPQPADLTDVKWLGEYNYLFVDPYIIACCDYYAGTLQYSIIRKLQQNYENKDRICLGVIVNKDGSDIREKLPTDANASFEYTSLLNNLAWLKFKEIDPILCDHGERAFVSPNKCDDPYDMSEEEADKYYRVLEECKQQVLTEGNEELDKLKKASEEHSEALQKYLRDNMAEYVGMKEYFAELGFEIAFDYTENEYISSLGCPFAIVGTKAQIMNYIGDDWYHYNAGYCEEKEVYFYLVPISAPAGK